MVTLKELQERNEAPKWMDNIGYKALSEKGYLLPGEAPRDMWKRVSKAAARHLPDSDMWEDKFFNLFWRGWLAGSTPVLANMGTRRGLPISCFGSYTADSTVSIATTQAETIMLTKMGGGTSSYFGDLRTKGSPITGGGKAGSKIAWLRLFKQTIQSVSQGGVRRGSFAAYVDAKDPEALDMLDWTQQKMVEEKEDRTPSAQMHLGVNWTKEDLEEVKQGGPRAEVFKKQLETRWEKGRNYMFFVDKVNDARPQVYKDKDMKIKASNLCVEICLPAWEDETFVCCLSSMNMAKFDEWKGTDAVYAATVFLDCVMEEFLVQGYRISGETSLEEGKSYLESALKFAQKHRALGLGMLGISSYFKKKRIVYGSLESQMLLRAMGKAHQTGREEATRWLAKTLGCPKMLKPYGIRNATTAAIAPNTTSAAICGGESEGRGVSSKNVYSKTYAWGVEIRKDKYLEELLEEKGKNTDDVWLRINADEGSVRSLEFLSDEEKQVFRTAFEVNPYADLRMADILQGYIDQGMSLNMFLPSDLSAQEVYNLHMCAAESPNIKSLYYVRTSSTLKADSYEEDVGCGDACSG